MPVVFIVNQVRDDISPAFRFGTIRCINQAYVHGDELERLGDDNVMPTGHMSNIVCAVVEFDPAQDYLLIAGDHLQLLAMVAALSVYPSFMVLRYDRQLNDYIPVRLYSGLVANTSAVLGSSDIGDNDHGESRNCPEPRNLEAITNLEIPLQRFDYFRRRPRDVT